MVSSIAWIVQWHFTHYMELDESFNYLIHAINEAHILAHAIAMEIGGPKCVFSHQPTRGKDYKVHHCHSWSLRWNCQHCTFWEFCEDMYNCHFEGEQ
jgi:hypothetical protein